MKQLEIFKWILMALALYMIYKLLNKFNLLGTSEDTKAATALGSSNALAEINKDNPLVKDAIVNGKTYAKMTPAERGSLAPNSSKFGGWIQDLWDASGTFNDNEDDVYNIFKLLSSQYETSLFAATFKVIKGKDLYLYLKSFMSDGELAEVYDITSHKKKS